MGRLTEFFEAVRQGVTEDRKALFTCLDVDVESETIKLARRILRQISTDEKTLFD